MNEVMVRKIAFDQMIELQIRKASKELSSVRVANKDHQRLIRAWSKPEILRTMVYAGGMGRWLRNVRDKAKKWVSDSVLKAWDAVSGQLSKFKTLFNMPKVLEALTKTLGEVTPSNIAKFVREGENGLAKALRSIKAVLVTPTGIPTLTDLIKRTVIGGNLLTEFNKIAKPAGDWLEKQLDTFLPRFGKRILIAAIFAVIWWHVDELSWEPADLIQGFTGALSVAELLVTLPESVMGLLTGRTMGIGFVIMPAMLLMRLSYLVSSGHLQWKNGEIQPNWAVIDPTKFKQAPKDPNFGKVRV